MKPLMVYGCLAMLLSGHAGAEPVYRCEEKGVITYTDQPCSTTASAHALPPPTVVLSPGPLEREQARRFDDSLARDRAERDRADAEWLKQYGNRRDREARVRRAIIEHRVIKSMTREEVKLALGEPDQIDRGDSYGTAKETWTYRQDGARRTVNFKDGQVTTTSRKGKRAR